MFKPQRLGSANPMAALFAVFLVAILAVVLNPDGRRERMTRLSIVWTRALGAGKIVLERGTEVLEVIGAWLAADHRSRPAP